MNLLLKCAGLAGISWLAFGSTPLLAQETRTDAPAPDDRVKIVNQNVGFDQKLNAQVPLNLAFKDEHGQIIHLRDYVRDKPVILALVWYECPTLCTEILSGMARSFKASNFKVGKQFEVVTVSINPAESTTEAAQKKEVYLQELGQPGAEKGWHFLTGEESSLSQLAAAVGCRYVYDVRQNQYAHPNGIVVLTPQGKVSRYFYGIDYPVKQLRFGLMESSQHHIGSLTEQILLTCYHYDPSTGKYSVSIMAVLRLASLMTIFAMAGCICVAVRREKQRTS